MWYIDPRRRLATVYRPDQLPQGVNESQALSGDNVLSGFCVVLGELFR